MALRDLLTRRRLALAAITLATIPFGLLANRYRWWGGKNAGAFAYEVLFIAAAQTVFIRARTRSDTRMLGIHQGTAALRRCQTRC